MTQVVEVLATERRVVEVVVAGPQGATPEHEVVGGSIRFRKADGSWGGWIVISTEVAEDAAAAAVAARDVATTKAGESLASATAAASSASSASTSATSAGTSATTATTKATEAAASAAATAVSASALSSLALSRQAGLDATLDLDLTSRHGAPFKGNFTRSTTGGYVRNSRGVLVPTVANEPMVDFGTDGKPLGTGFFASYTQLLLNSAALSTQNVTTTAQSYTLSFWGTGSITLSGAAAGTLVGTGTDNRVSLTLTATAGTLTLTTSGTVSRAMLTSGAVVLPYVESAGATVTRNADSMAISGSDFTDFYNAVEGTFYAEFMFPNASAFGYAVTLFDGATAILGLVRSSANSVDVLSSGGWNAAITGPANNPSTTMKAAFSYSSVGMRLGVNGVASYSDATIVMKAANSIQVCRSSSGSLQPNGYIRRLTYWPKALTQSQLEALTL